ETDPRCLVLAPRPACAPCEAHAIPRTARDKRGRACPCDRSLDVIRGLSPSCPAALETADPCRGAATLSPGAPVRVCSCLAIGRKRYGFDPLPEHFYRFTGRRQILKRLAAFVCSSVTIVRPSSARRM